MRRFVFLVVALYSVVPETPSARTEPEASTLRDLARRLASNGTPAGVVVPEGVLGRLAVDDGPPGATNRPLKLWDPAGLALFNQRNVALSAKEANGVIHVRGADEPRTIQDLLETPIVVDEANGITVIDSIFRRVVGAMRGHEPDALMGTGIMPSRECPVDATVTVPGGSTTPIELLDAIVRQTPGIVWLVTYRPESPTETVKVGLLCADGWTLTMEVFD
jgi:hypothetical protein